jgi:hypothetical protein
MPAAHPEVTSAVLSTSLDWAAMTIAAALRVGGTVRCARLRPPGRAFRV